MNFLGTGYGLWVPTFTLDGSTKIFQTVFMVKYGTVATPALIDSEMRLNLVGSGKPFAAGNMYIGFTLARSEAWRQTSTDTEYFLNETAVVGTKSTSAGTPINTSILVKKNTGLSGRRYRGRFMLPNMYIPETSISQAGIISGVDYTTYQTAWQAAIDGIISGPMDPVLGHSSSEVLPTPYTTVTVQPKVGTMRRRIR